MDRWEILYRDNGEWWGYSNICPTIAFLNPRRFQKSSTLRPLVAYNPRTKEVIY